MKKTITFLMLSMCWMLSSGQRMLVLPDTPAFANQNMGVWVLRTADLFPYYSNGQRWIKNTGSGTVTSVQTGYGLTGGPITNSGLLLADTTSVNGLVSKTRLNNSLINIGSKWNLSGSNISNNNSGNVGVKTTSPDSALTVYGGLFTTGGVRLTGVPEAVGAKQLRYNPGTGRVSYADTGTALISGLLPATAPNIIDNGNYEQVWRWNSLSGPGGITITSNSTAAAGNNQILFRSELTGTNSNANQTTISTRIHNTHNGTGAVNIGIDAYADFGSTNTAIRARSSATGNAIAVPASAGRVGIGTETPDSLLTVNGGLLVTGGVRFSNLPTGKAAKQIYVNPSTGTLSVGDTVTGSGGGSGSIGADNGLYVSGGGNVGLGHPVGQSGNPLSGNREIQTGGNGIYIRNSNTWLLINSGQLIFNDSSTAVGTGTYEKTWLKFLPLKKGAGGKNFGIHQTSNKTLVTSNTYNEVFKIGVNIVPGGGIEKPEEGFAMWESWESKYDPDGNDEQHWGERIFAYKDTGVNSQEVRLEMWTIKPRPQQAGPDATYFISPNRFFLKSPKDVNNTYAGFSLGLDDTTGNMNLTGRTGTGVVTYLIGPNSTPNEFQIGPATGRAGTFTLGGFQNVAIGGSGQLYYDGTNNVLEKFNSSGNVGFYRGGAGNTMKAEFFYNYGDASGKGGMYADFNSGEISLKSVNGYYTAIHSGGLLKMLFSQTGVAVGDAPSSVTASVALEVSSTNKAFLLPRMTTTARDAMTATNGMMIYNTTLNKFQGYENGAWGNLIQ